MSRLWKYINIWLMLAGIAFAASPVRIKELTTVKGVRNNQLTGIGLVIGLRGMGDSPQFQLTRKMLFNLVTNNGYSIDLAELNSKNIAAVMITAETRGVMRAGDALDVTVSSLGDAKSLDGGILLQTALKAADGNVYAVAQGRVLAGAKNSGAETTASVPAGAIIEREIVGSFIRDGVVQFQLKNPDFTTANLMREAIIGFNDAFEVEALDSGAVIVRLDEESLKDPINTLAQIEALTITPDYAGAVVIDRKTGVIVSGGQVVLQECVVSTPSLYLSVGKQSSARNATNQKKTTIKVSAATIDELVATLNQAGITQQEITALLEALHRTGALHARLILM